MSNLEDSRVLSAFGAQQGALPYMINLEQRLTGANGLIESQSSQINSYGENISILNSWIYYYNNTVFPSVVYRNIVTTTFPSTQIPLSGSSFSDIVNPSTSTPLSVTINLQSPNLLVFLTATDFWISSGGSAANADVALQLDSGTEVIVCRTYSDNSPNQNTYGIGASYIFEGLATGTHTVKARCRVFSGATAYIGASLLESTIQLCAIQF